MDCTGFGKDFDESAKHVIAVFMFSFAGFGSISNILSFICIYQIEKHLSCSVKILLSLVVTDAFVCLVSLPIQASRMVSTEVLSSLLIEVVSFHTMIFSFWFSTFIVCLIACDRYILLVKYTRHHELVTTKNVYITFAVCFAISMFGPALKLWKPPVFAACHIFMLLLPNIWLPIAYTLIVKDVNKKKRELMAKQNTTTTSSDKDKATQKHITNAKPIVNLIGAYFACSVMPVISACLYIANRRLHFMSVNTHDWFRVFGLFGMTISSCINPLIYAMRLPVFKKKLKQIFIAPSTVSVIE